MKTKLLNLWYALRTSFWLVPALMVMMAIALALSMVVIDERVNGWVKGLGWVYARGPEGARAILETIAGSMITVAGVVFSITIVALQLASSQFGPRLLYNFRRDTINQVVPGTFIATFVYCLLVLPTIQGKDGSSLVPHLSVAFGIALALVSLGVLIHFIHHIAGSIQAENVVAAVGRELEGAINGLFPEKGPRCPEEPERSWPEQTAMPLFNCGASPVKATASDYVQTIDTDRLISLATKYDLVLRLLYRPGQFVVQGSALALVQPEECMDDKLAERINAAYTVGVQRTLVQDVEFPVNQLVEIALRALSPGVNDPFTAIRCVDQLGAALCHLTTRSIPSPYLCSEEGVLRVIARPLSFRNIVDAAFDQIRQSARSNAAVTLRLLETIALIAERVDSKEDHTALLRQAQMTRRGSQTGLPEEWDREAVEERYRTVVKVLLGPS